MLKTKRLCRFSFSIALVLGAPVVAWGAACCGGGFSAPSLIAGDDQAQLAASYGYTQIAYDLDTQGYWYEREQIETGESYRLDGAHVFADRWQAGASLPVLRRATAEQSSAGLGDIAMALGYEVLPDWDYNPWRPKGLVFIQLTAPTGRSVADANPSDFLQVRGRGFWSLAVGTLLTKTIHRYDLFINADVHRSLPRAYSQAQVQGTLVPGYGGNIGAGGGYNWRQFRIGASLTWSYEDPIAMRGSVDSAGSAQRLATASYTLSYLPVDDWTATLAYNDQTQFGDPQNTTLGRGAMLMVQKRWPR